MTKLGVFWVAGVMGVVAATIATPTRADAPAPDAARVELGRRLFFDPAIGRRGSVACAACHDPEHGFSDARATSQDEDRLLARHSQPLTDLGGTGFHWDGEFDTVRDVIDARVLPGVLAARSEAARALRRLRSATRADGSGRPDPIAAEAVLARLAAGGTYGAEHGPLPDAAAVSVADRIARGGRYDEGFRAAFGDATVTSQRAGDALEAYVGSLRTTTSPFDRFAAGDESAIGESARRGFELFRGKAACSQCHVAEGARPAFADGKFHNTGVETRRRKAQQSGGEDSAADLGRLGVTFADADWGAYKTPSLRDVARRPPYFHDASGRTLADVVRYYDEGGTANDRLDARLHPLGLTDGDVADLVAFLESLTGAERPGLGPVGGLRAARLTVRVEDLDGAPIAGRSVELRPFGDRLAGTSAMPRPVTTTTDANGDAVLDMPASTHVVVAAEGAGVTPPLPDWTTSARFIRTPKDRVSAHVRFADEARDRPSQFVVYIGGFCESVARSVFTRVRDLGTNEALYASEPRRNAAGADACQVCLPKAWTANIRCRLDFRPGAENLIDLRPLRREAGAADAEALRSVLADIRAFRLRGAPK